MTPPLPAGATVVVNMGPMYFRRLGVVVGGSRAGRAVRVRVWKYAGGWAKSAASYGRNFVSLASPEDVQELMKGAR